MQLNIASSATYTVGVQQGALDLSPSASLTIGSATVALTTGFASGDVLSFAGTSTISSQYNVTTGMLTLSGTDSPDNYIAAIEAVKFQPGTNPGTSRTVTWKLDDGTQQTSTITIVVPSVTFFAEATTTPTNVTEVDHNAVELGMEFSTNVAGQISGMAFYKGPQNTGTHTGTLWSAVGVSLATGTFSGETASGWQHLTFSSPVSITAGTNYVVSYHTTTGMYSADPTFTSSMTANGITVPASGGVFLYGAHAFPGPIPPVEGTNTYQGSNYYVDVVFQPSQQQQQPPPPPPPPPPPNGSIILGVAAPWNAAWHATQPAPGGGGVQGQVWLPGPNGEQELVWNAPQDFQYWENAVGYAAGSIVNSGGGIATDTDSRGGWQNYLGSAWSSAVQAFCAGRGPAGLWLNIPPFPKGIGATLAQAGTGAYNANYTAIAQTLAGAGYTQMVFRLAWEFEGGWYAWGWGFPGINQATYVTDYIAAFRQMALTIRAVIPQAKFVFNAADGTIMTAANGTPTWQSCYPGDDVVDFVAIDTYDGLRSKTTPASARWANDQAPGIASSQALALAHGKGWAVPEWGQGLMGDNPLYVSNMAAAAKAYAAHGLPVMMGYWNSTDPNSGYVGYMDTTANPLSWAAYCSTNGFHV